MIVANHHLGYSTTISKFLAKIYQNGSDGKIVLDLNGPEGNAFVILGYAKKTGTLLGLDVTAIQKEMMAGDYEQLLSVFMKYFRDYVVLHRETTE